MKKNKKILVCIFSLFFSFCFCLPFFINNKKVVSATTISTQSLNFVIPSVYYPCSNGTYTYYYTMPIYIGNSNGKIIVNYPRSSDGKIVYYYQVSISPDSQLTHIELGGLVGAVKSANYTYYANFRTNPNVICTINIQTPSINDFNYTLDNPLFFSELQSKLNYINVQIQGSSIYYSCYDFNDNLVFYFTLTDLVATSITNAFNQKFTPLFIQSTVNINEYAQQLIDLAFAKGNVLGYNEGYENGYRDGVHDIGEGKIYTFHNLISAVIDVPINSFKSLLNFNFLGINILDFALALLTLFLVIKIVGVINGKT